MSKKETEIKRQFQAYSGKTAVGDQEMDTDPNEKQRKKNRAVSVLVIAIGVALTGVASISSTIDLSKLVGFLGLTLSGVIYYFLNRKNA